LTESRIPLALGTAQFGLAYGVANKQGRISRVEAKAIFNVARSNRIDTLDTAIAYGESETHLGELGVADFKVVTKIPPFPLNHSNIEVWIRGQLAGSLDRLNADSIYGVLLHRSQDLLGPHGKIISRLFEQFKSEGVIEKFGISIYAPSELPAIIGNYQIDLVQAPFNLVDNRLYSSGWLSRLSAAGIEVHTRSAFLQGLLLMPPRELPNYFIEWAELWSQWESWLNENDVSAMDACMAFLKRFSGIDRVVVGVDSSLQLEQIVRASLNSAILDLPKISSLDEGLVNPSSWKLQCE